MSDDSVGVVLVPLYSDERIKRAVEAADFRHYKDELAENLMRDMRDDYERDRDFWAAERQQDKARINALQAALDEARERVAWEPVPDGEVSSFMYVDNGGKLLGIFAGDEYTDWYATEDLPENIRLCQLTTVEADAVSDEVREAIQTILDAASVDDVVYTFDARMKVIKWLDTPTGTGGEGDDA